MEQNSPKGPRFVRWAVMLAIVVVLNIFFLGIRGIVFSEPKYETFCPTPTPIAAPAKPTDAVQSGSTSPIQTDAEITKCNDAFQAAETAYQQHTFILIAILGVLAIIIGVIPFGSAIVSSGLSYGGVLALVIASAQYWNDAGSWIRLTISLIALVALLYIGFKRFRD
jgi:hypothetical protein